MEITMKKIWTLAIFAVVIFMTACSKHIPTPAEKVGPWMEAAKWIVDSTNDPEAKRVWDYFRAHYSEECVHETDGAGFTKPQDPEKVCFIPFVEEYKKITPDWHVSWFSEDGPWAFYIPGHSIFVRDDWAFSRYGKAYLSMHEIYHLYDLRHPNGKDMSREACETRAVLFGIRLTNMLGKEALTAVVDKEIVQMQDDAKNQVDVWETSEMFVDEMAEVLGTPQSEIERNLWITLLNEQVGIRYAKTHGKEWRFKGFPKELDTDQE
jgi:hypothetical protein